MAAFGQPLDCEERRKMLQTIKPGIPEKMFLIRMPWKKPDLEIPEKKEESPCGLKKRKEELRDLGIEARIIPARGGRNPVLIYNINQN